MTHKEFTAVHMESGSISTYKTTKAGENITISNEHYKKVEYDGQKLTIVSKNGDRLVISDCYLFDLPEIISILAASHGNLLSKTLIFEGKPIDICGTKSDGE